MFIIMYSFACEDLELFVWIDVFIQPYFSEFHSSVDICSKTQILLQTDMGIASFKRLELNEENKSSNVHEDTNSGCYSMKPSHFNE